ncbi:MAG: hypothetical protein JZU64_05655 [Rhodoferax sp.]|nr:hypothetical protein [Rhodoferax sp.]
MPTSNPSCWSDTLQHQTRLAIDNLAVTPDGKLHFKHGTLGFAWADFFDLRNDRLLLRAKKSDQQYDFDSVEGLLQAGWAVD